MNNIRGGGGLNLSGNFGIIKTLWLLGGAVADTGVGVAGTEYFVCVSTFLIMPEICLYVSVNQLILQ